jgi:hypothetical protein
VVILSNLERATGGRTGTSAWEDCGPEAHLLHRNIQVTFLSSTEIHEFDRLSVLCASLRSLGLKVAAFDDAKSAVVWLADRT